MKKLKRLLTKFQKPSDKSSRTKIGDFNLHTVNVNANGYELTIVFASSQGNSWLAIAVGSIDEQPSKEEIIKAAGFTLDELIRFIEYIGVDPETAKENPLAVLSAQHKAFFETPIGVYRAIMAADPDAVREYRKQVEKEFKEQVAKMTHQEASNDSASEALLHWSQHNTNAPLL